MFEIFRVLVSCPRRIKNIINHKITFYFYVGRTFVIKIFKGMESTARDKNIRILIEFNVLNKDI